MHLVAFRWKNDVTQSDIDGLSRHAKVYLREGEGVPQAALAERGT
jgi:hypothetical protein